MKSNNNNNWKKLSDGLMVSIPSRSQSQVPARSPKKNVTTRNFETDDGTEPIHSPVAQPKVKPVIQYSPAAVAVAIATGCPVCYERARKKASGARYPRKV
jgi:hypothetical protein